jgi:hypothetical protein
LELGTAPGLPRVSQFSGVFNFFQGVGFITTAALAGRHFSFSWGLRCFVDLKSFVKSPAMLLAYQSNSHPKPRKYP